MTTDPSPRRAIVASALAVFASFAILAAAAGFALGISQESVEQPEATDWFSESIDDGAQQLVRTLAVGQFERELRAEADRVAGGKAAEFEGVPFTSYGLSLSPTTSPSFADLLMGAYESTAVVEYQLPVDKVVVKRSVDASFRLTSQGWQLDDVSSDDRDLWTYGVITSARAGQSLVVASQALSYRADSLAQQTDAARRQVEQFWTAGWPGKVVVQLPAEPAWMDTLIGHKAASEFPAVTTTSPGKPDPVLRVTVNPDVFYDLPYIGQQIIMRHEIAHVAQNGLADNRVPTWLAEGLATYIGYRGSGVPDYLIAQTAFADVASGGLPTSLPKEDAFDFDLTVRQRQLAYEQGWAACAMIAERYGEGELVPFYVSMGRASGGATSQLNEAARKSFGLSGQEFTAQWQAWLSENA